tara:strand:+ start:370 stop:666 length:297 start_codon:yes stop_codon:yes gene_type:complete
MKNITLKTSAFVALFSFAAIAFASNGEDDKLVQKFTKIDTNGDGFIDKTEAKPVNEGKLLRKFDRVDTNADGKISLEEAKAFKAAKKQAKDRKNAATK